MGVLVLRKKIGRKLLSCLLISTFLLTDFVFFAEKALAAQVSIDTAASTASAEHTILGSATVFTTDQIGYRFYVDSTGTCVYSKTTDGGTSWGTAVVVDATTTCFGVVVWFDKWTPGDTGDNIHILSAETGTDDLWYNRLDTTNDSLLSGTAGVSVSVNTGQGGTISSGANVGSITKGTDGTIYLAISDNTDSYVVECSTACDVTTSWTETGTNPMDLQPDYSLLMPLPSGDILLINRDVSADDMRSKVWDDSAGSWSGAWTNIDISAFENITYDPQFGAAIDSRNGNIYLAYVDTANGTIGGANDDIRVWTYSGGVWSAGGDVLTNSALGVVDVSVAVDGNTGNVYVSYVAQTTPGTVTTARVYWKQSTNAMATWGAQQGPVDTLGATNKYGLSINLFNYERIYVSWFGVAPQDIYGDTIADITPFFVVSASGAQKTSVRPQTTDFYIGGKFVFDENVATRNVTSVTITETGTTDASVSLDNIELWYDLDISAPYDCESEAYGTGSPETQFGTTDTDGFSGPNGTATFTGSVSVSPTQAMCVYTVLDTIKYATEGTTIDIEISNPGTDVIVSGGVTAVPATAQAISESTIITPNSDFKIQRGVSTLTGDSLTITAGTDYEAPVSASSAFIRITNTQNTGAGRNTGGGTSNADDTTVYVTNPANITSDITFARGNASINNTRVAWEIIEYQGDAGGDNEMIVRQQEAVSYLSGSATLNGTITGTVTNDADVAVFVTGIRNNNTGSASYHLGAVTSAWNAGTDRAVFTRGGTGSIADVSYALVEFVGPNWRVQRVENTFAAAGVTETEAITAVNSLSRTFLHTQKRMSVSSHANFGHEVWLSGIGQVSFLIDSTATTPTGQVSVAWVIENTQTLGTPMDVTRSNGAIASGGTAPQSNIVSIGKTLPDITIASIFTNNSSDGALNTWPEPIVSVRLVSATQYEMWRSDTGANLDYRTEVVEWPTTERKLTQNYYRLYVDNDTLTPTDPWPAGATNLGENTEMTANDEPTAPGELVRIRMSVTVGGARMPALFDSFKLQYAARVTSCGAATTWNDVGDIGSTTAHWRGFNGTPVDGTQLSVDPPNPGDLLVSVSDVAGTYEEQNNSSVNPHLVLSNDDVEYDWLVQHHDAMDKTSYCFRMVEDDGTLFVAYTNYPVIRTVGYEPLMTNWRWYDDENNLTPSTPLGGENVSPSNIESQNILKLRASLRESSGADGVDIKFALQYSELADFSADVFTLTSTSTCGGNSTWCYADGAGVDNAVIASKVISSADACSLGVGTGCGTHNESTSTINAIFDQQALTDTEFEFTLKQSNAGPNTVYYFRLYNLTYDEVVGVAPTFSNPSLVTEGALLSSAIGGTGAGVSVAGVVTDVATTPTAISFGDVPFDTDVDAAQQISITTNAKFGYQLLAFGSQDLTNSFGETIAPVVGTNAAPTSWILGCLVSAPSCFGYHSTDATLDGGSGRFGPLDSFARLETTPQEVMYSSIPTADSEYLLYRIRVTPDQPNGDYETDIIYIAVPVY